MAAYAKLSTEFYDLDKPSAPPDAFDFYLEYARRASGPILEPMCGSGRFLLPLLAEGFDIEGVDASLDMLEACRARARALGLAPILHEQRLEALEVERRFALIFIPSGSFSLLTDRDVALAALRQIHGALLPSGRFVVEVEQVQQQSPNPTGIWSGRFISRPDGAKIIVSFLSEYSGVQAISRGVHRYELVKDGQILNVEYEDFDVKFYALREFQTLLETAGFVDIHAYSPYSSRSADESDEALIFDCTPG